MPKGNIAWLDYPEAERFSAFSLRTLRRLIRDGRLRAKKIGREMRIDKRSLEAFLENHPAQPRLPGFEEADGYPQSLEKGDRM
jgi:excisionase family DNA binding protein